MNQKRLEVPQKTMYGIHRPVYYANKDQHRNVPFVDTVPPMQKWEFIFWSIISGMVLGFVAFGGLSNFTW